MTDDHEGGCHCKKVRYSCSAKPVRTLYCHCLDCQSLYGAPFATVIAFLKDQIKVEGELKTYEVSADSGEPVYKMFCEACGTHIISAPSAYPDIYYFLVGTLDDPSWVKPEMHVHTSRQQPWIKIDDTLPKN